MINSVFNNQIVSNNFNNQKSYNAYSGINTASKPVYKADSFSISNSVVNDNPEIIIPKEVPTDDIPMDPPYKVSFFKRPEVRLGGMILGTSAVGGGIGYAIGSAFGKAGLGAGIGASFGVLAPVAIIGYALWSWGRGH